MASLPNRYLTSIAVDPILQDHALVVGTEVGTFLSPRPDSRAAAALSTTISPQPSTWRTLGSGLPPVTVWDLTAIPNGRIIAGTHGRGTWEITTNR